LSNVFHAHISISVNRKATSVRGLGWLVSSALRTGLPTSQVLLLIKGCLVGNTQLALQIIKRNQLLPSVKMLSDMRKKPVFQPVHSIQPIQMPAFTTVQRKWGRASTCCCPAHEGLGFCIFFFNL